MKNAEYWRTRQEILQNNLMKKADDLIPEIEDKYQTAINDMDKEIQSFYERFAKNESLTIADARKILNSDERKRFQMDLKEYIKKGEENGISADWEKQLESASDIHRIDRLRALQMQMREKVEELSGYKQKGLDKTLADVYKEGYYKNIFEIQKYVGTGSAFAVLDQKKIDTVLAKPWTYDNQTYSDKIWQNRDRLNYALDKALTQGIIRGQAPDKVSRQIAKELNMELSSTKRLVLTESAAFSSMASQDSYKELGVEKVEYLTTLDDKTCEMCAPMDGKVFDMKDFEMSVNAPPLHPNCRCTTVPYFNDEFTQDEKRAARDSEGKSYTVPGDMTYRQWKEKYVDNASENDIINSGALTNRNDPYQDKREAHAKLYYKEVRNSDKESIIKTIAKNTGFAIDEISKMYDHVFVNKYNLSNGYERFYPDYNMAESVRRLREGKNIQKHDLTLINHESMEYDLMNKEKMNYVQAHKLAEKKYNYSKELNEFLDKFKLW
ncbi:MAG: minor capsid protein [Clostridia bacterium]|nr:minor capsid protein [Clostridia bacterium]